MNCHFMQAVYLQIFLPFEADYLETQLVFKVWLDLKAFGNVLAHSKLC